MENSKKVILALGLALSVVSGGNVQAMEQCDLTAISSVTKEIEGLRKEINSLFSSIGKEEINNLSQISTHKRLDWRIDEFRKINIYEPFDQLYLIKEYLNLISQVTKEKKNERNMQAAILKLNLVTLKLQKLFNLMKNICGITEAQIANSDGPANREIFDIDIEG